jgi:hypothetical protein
MRQQKKKGGFFNLFDNSAPEQIVDKWGNKIVDVHQPSVSNNSNSNNLSLSNLLNENKETSYTEPTPSSIQKQKCHHEIQQVLITKNALENTKNTKFVIESDKYNKIEKDKNTLRNAINKRDYCFNTMNNLYGNLGQSSSRTTTPVRTRSNSVSSVNSRTTTPVRTRSNSVNSVNSYNTRGGKRKYRSKKNKKNKTKKLKK